MKKKKYITPELQIEKLEAQVMEIPYSQYVKDGNATVDDEIDDDDDFM